MENLTNLRPALPPNATQIIPYRDQCDPGLLLPIIPWENSWNSTVRGSLYFIGLIYCFLGVAIVADVFMGSIEKITSKTRKIYLSTGKDSEPEVIEVRIWNDTVANLTLMALGSSAPEILLSCIEIVGNNFQVGELGPGTIVGSAAFNLLAISAVCILCIPTGEVRAIRLFKVFLITAVFSLFAYIWLLLIIKYITPGVVDVWEAALTFLFFPTLVGIAWWADRDWKCGKRVHAADQDQQIELGDGRPGGESTGLQAGIGQPKISIIDTDSPDPKPTSPQIDGYVKTETTTADGSAVVDDLLDKVDTAPNRGAETMLDKQKKLFLKDGEVNKEGLIEFYKDLRKYPDISDKDAAILAATKLIDSQHHSRMWYRISGMREVTGSKRVHPVLSEKLRLVYDTINESPDVPDIGSLHAFHDSKNEKAIVEFEAATFSVPENIGKFNITVVRHGRLDNTVRVRIESFDGSAKQGSDYVPINEQIVFGPYAKEREVTVKIIDDNQWEPDEEFFLRLSMVHEDFDRRDVTLGRLPIMEIVILNDDEPGMLQFRKRGILVKESSGVASLEVERINGADGDIAVQWKTIDGSAKSPEDFEGGEGTLNFKHGETLRVIEIPIVDDAVPEKDECFEIELFNPTGGAKLGRVSKAAITITNDDAFNSVVERMKILTTRNIQSMQVYNETWNSQIHDALTVNGGDVEGASNFDYFMHFLTFGWKIIFALIPPPSIWGGWLCFFSSLAVIGLLTAIVGDLASIFGCLVGLEDSVTAITFVALGTSLPDLFASKLAATSEKYADNAIGNVTGSNSVNVFLGLGLPWLIAAIYHAAQGNILKVEEGTLGFSVLVYSVVACLALVLIMARRFLKVFGNAELGGPTIPRYVSGIFLITLWFVYVILSALKAYNYKIF